MVMSNMQCSSVRTHSAVPATTTALLYWQHLPCYKASAPAVLLLYNMCYNTHDNRPANTQQLPTLLGKTQLACNRCILKVEAAQHFAVFHPTPAAVCNWACHFPA
jgi:hypothetical protein